MSSFPQFTPSVISDFKDRRTTQKGKLGEDICFEFLRKSGCTIYRPDRDDRAHPIDALVMHGDKVEIFAADIKTKPSREKYFDTGIDARHYAKYDLIQRRNSVKVFLFFVDEEVRFIYGNFLHKLQEVKVIQHHGKQLVYPLTDRNIVYFPLKSMVHIGSFPPEEAEKIRALRNTHYKVIIDDNQRTFEEALALESERREIRKDAIMAQLIKRDATVLHT